MIFVVFLVCDVMFFFFGEMFGNLFSDYVGGWICVEVIEDFCGWVFLCIGVEWDEIIFMFGGMESFNFVILGMMLMEEGSYVLVIWFCVDKNYMIIIVIEYLVMLWFVEYFE